MNTQAVKALISTRRDITGFIGTANLLVTESLVGKGMSEERLTQIELYLSAHFVAITTERGSLIGEKVESSEQAYSYTPFTAGLGSTRFGQQAITLDTSGTLLAMTKQQELGVGGAGKKALFRVVESYPRPTGAED